MTNRIARRRKSPPNRKSRKSPPNRKSRKSPSNRKSRKSPSNRKSRKSPSNRKSRKSPSNRKSRKSRMSFFKRNSISVTPVHSKTLEQIIDKETGLIPEGYLRDIILEYHFDNKKFIDKFIKEAVDGNTFIPKKDLPLLKKSIESIVEYASSSKNEEIINLLNSLRGKLHTQSIRILWELQDELEKYW